MMKLHACSIRICGFTQKRVEPLLYQFQAWILEIIRRYERLQNRQVQDLVPETWYTMETNHTVTEVRVIFDEIFLYGFV
jgi:hypothetical protein